ncbi:hypothetical protein PCE1_001426 [Barthelona sp. PCE]
MSQASVIDFQNEFLRLFDLSSGFYENMQISDTFPEAKKCMDEYREHTDRLKKDFAILLRNLRSVFLLKEQKE